ncbi:MAG: hypothetical protein H6686_10960 [Fibrobacteria bacterium]|nr:hypothetical protein [Fibrobacteria bacterium]
MLSLTAHPVALIGLPAVGDAEETFLHLQLDAVLHPAQRWSPVAHLSWTRVTSDFGSPENFEKGDIHRVALELGGRYRLFPERGWYTDAMVGWLFESYRQKWAEITRKEASGKVTTSLIGDVDNIFQEPYAMWYAGWATDPTRRIRWDLGVGLGIALLGGKRELHDIEWTGIAMEPPSDHKVDLFPASPLVFDLNLGVGVNF